MANRARRLIGWSGGFMHWRKEVALGLSGGVGTAPAERQRRNGGEAEVSWWESFVGIY